MAHIQIRQYISSDYSSLKSLYENTGWFDPETDAENRLNAKSQRDSESLLVAEIDGEIVGSVSLLEDERIALFFRLVAIGDNEKEIRHALLTKGAEILKNKGYSQAHVTVLEEDIERQQEYDENGFSKGREYRWMWKKL